MKVSKTIIKLLLLCLVTPIAQMALGQVNNIVLYGTIKDATTREPLPGATIRVKETLRGTATDSKGSYRLLLPASGQATLQIRYVGYVAQTKRVTLGGTDSLQLHFLLAPDDNRLSELVVVEKKNEARLLKESAMPISVITTRQIEGTSSSITDVIARTSGITVRSTGGVGSPSRISVRGLEGKRMGMFVDDAPMNLMSDFITLNDIPTDMIERVEIYKGIVPYKLGGSALGGAVNIVTKEYPPVYSDVSYEVSSFNTHKLNTANKFTNHTTGLQFGIGGVFTYSDNNYKMRLTNLDDRIVRRNHDQYRQLIFGGSILATKWWFDELKMELVYARNRNEIQGLELDVREAFNRSESLITSLILKRANFFLPGLDLDFDFNYMAGQYGLTDNASARYDWDGNKFPPVSGYGGEVGQFPSEGKNRSHNFQSKLNLNYIINKHHAINLNVTGGHQRQFPKDDLMDKALGYKANFPSRMTNIVVGLSYDLTLFGGKFQSATTLKDYFFSSHSKVIEQVYISSPKEANVSRNYLGISEAMRYRLTKELMIKLGGSSEVRIPTGEELLGNGYSILPTPNLTPERSLGGNLGLLFHQNNRNGFIETELNLFYNKVDNMIRFTADIIPTMARYRNFGSVGTYGVEAEFKGDLLPWLYTYINGTYQDLRDLREYVPGTSVENPTKGKRIPNIPYLMANAGLELHRENLFGGEGQNSRFLCDLSYIHEYFYDFELSLNQERKIPTSFVTNLAVEHSFNNSRWTLTLRVNNLFNRELYSELNRPLPGRSFGFKVRYLLK